MLLVFDFLRTESTWRRDALVQSTSTTRKLAPKLGSVFSWCIFAGRAPGSDTVIVAQRPDETAEKFIWSVCFSPSGKLLATAASDGVVRVSSRTFVLAAVVVVTIIFEANAQHGATFGTLDLGYCHEANPQRISGSHQGGLLGRFLVKREIPRFWVVRWYDEDSGDDGRVVEDPRKHRQRSCCG